MLGEGQDPDLSFLLPHLLINTPDVSSPLSEPSLLFSEKIGD